jgi:uncharacterized protein YyaL (SSP411 family)
MLDHDEFREKAELTLKAFASRLERGPSAMPQMLVAMNYHLAKPRQVVIAGDASADDTRALLRAVHEEFIPNKILLLADGSDGQALLGRHLEFIQDVEPINGKATAYVCENYVCDLPTTDVTTLRSQLKTTNLNSQTTKE